MFNRFYQPDIDIEKWLKAPGEIFSTDADLSKSLTLDRYRLCGCRASWTMRHPVVHAPEGVSKGYLGGASAVEICSALYQNSYAIIGVCPLPERMDGTQRDGEHQPVQRHAECKRPERDKHFRTYPVPEIFSASK